MARQSPRVGPVYRKSLAPDLGDEERCRLLTLDQQTQSLGRALVDGGHGLDVIPDLTKQIIEGQGWRRRLMDRTGELVEFDSFEAWVTALPLEGLGTNLRLLRNLCRDDLEALAAIDAAVAKGPGNPTGVNQHGGTVDNVHDSERPAGN